MQHPELWSMVYGLRLSGSQVCGSRIECLETAGTKTKANATAFIIVVSTILY
jgi:hypothetical protein